MEKAHIGLHRGCERCKEFNIIEADKAIFNLKMQMDHPNFRPQTSIQMKQRADRLQQIRTAVLLNGSEVKEEYK